MNSPEINDEVLPISQIKLSRWKFVRVNQGFNSYRYYMVEKGPIGYWPFLGFVTSFILALYTAGQWFSVHNLEKAMANVLKYDYNSDALMNMYTEQYQRDLKWAIGLSILIVIILVFSIIFARHRTWIGLGDKNMACSFGPKPSDANSIVFPKNNSTKVIIDDSWLNKAYRVKLIRADGKEETIFEPMSYDSADECKYFLDQFLAGHCLIDE